MEVLWWGMMVSRVGFVEYGFWALGGGGPAVAVGRRFWYDHGINFFSVELISAAFWVCIEICLAWK